MVRGPGARIVGEADVIDQGRIKNMRPSCGVRLAPDAARLVRLLHRLAGQVAVAVHPAVAHHPAICRGGAAAGSEG